MTGIVAFRDLISRGLIELLGLVFLHSLWSFCLLALLTAVTLRCMHAASSQMRYLVALGFLLLMTVCPLVTGILVSGQVPASELSLVVSEESQDITPPGTSSSTGSQAQSGDYVEHEPGRASVPSPVRIIPEYTSGNHYDRRLPTGGDRDSIARLVHPWLPAFVVFWLSGAVLFSLRPLVGWWTIRHLRRTGINELSAHVQHLVNATTEKMGVRRAIRFVQSTAVTAPIVVGWLRPLVLLPISVLTGLTDAQLQAVIAHEIAHVRRHDYLINMMQTVVESLFFYHPAVWWLSGRIRTERELCCDDIVVETLHSRDDYGRALLAIADLRGNGGLLALEATDGPLLYRVKRLFGRNTVSRSPLVTVMSAVAFLVLVAGGIVTLARYQGSKKTPPEVSLTAESDLMDDKEMLAWQQLFASDVTLNGGGFHSRALYRHARFLDANNYPDKDTIRRLYRDARKPITEVSLFDASDAVWPLLPQLISVEALGISATRMSPAAWKSIGQMRGLRKIHLVNNRTVLPSDLQHLGGLTKLEHIDIMLTGYSLSDDEIAAEVKELSAEEQRQIDEWKASARPGRSRRVMEMAILTDRALSSLTNLKNLRSLKLINTHCTGQGLAAVQHLKQIEHFDVGMAADLVTGARVLGSWTRLRSIQGFNLSDEIIVEWSRLTNLAELDGWAGDVTLASVDTLARFQRLKKLGLRGSRLTVGDISRLLELRSEAKQQLTRLDLTHGRYISESEATRLTERFDDVEFRFSDNLPPDVEVPETRYSGHVRTPDGNPPPENAIVTYDVRHNSGVANINSQGGNIPVDGDTFAYKGPTGELWLIAYADGYAPSWTGPHFLKPEQPLENLDIVLDKGVVVTIEVVDRNGGAIEGATIHALPGITGSFEGFAAKYARETGGAYVFEHLARCRYRVTIKADGFKTLEPEPFVPEDGSKITFVMRR